MMAARRVKAKTASPPPCFSVSVNGKHVATMGMPGEGGVNKPTFRFKNLRFGEDQMPSPENPTYVVVRNVSVWADKGGVLLRANDKGNVPRLTTNGARKVAKALLHAADEFDRRRRKARG